MDDPSRKELPSSTAGDRSAAGAGPAPRDRTSRQHGRGWPHRLRKRWRTLPDEIRLRLLLAISALILACGIASILANLTAARIEDRLQSGQWHLEQAVAILTDKPLDELNMADFEAANQHLLLAESLFRQARAEIEPFEPYLGLLGGDAKALPSLMDIALNTTLAGEELYAGLEPLLTLWLAEPDSPALAYRPGTEERVIAPLLAGQPRLLEARAHLAEALAARQRIDRPALSDGVDAMLGEIDRSLPLLYDVTDTLVNAPDLLTSLLGLHEPKSYLVMAQNNDELRPTGGWVGTYGVLVVKEG